MTSQVENEGNANFSERLKTLRQKLGRTRDEMGELLEITGNYVYLLEAGKKTASDKVISKVKKLENRATEELASEPLALHDAPMPYGAEKLHSITTKSELAAACVEHFHTYINSIGDTAGLLERTLERLRAAFPITNRPRPQSQYEQHGKALTKTDPAVEAAASKGLAIAAQSITGGKVKSPPGSDSGTGASKDKKDIPEDEKWPPEFEN